MLVKVDTFKKMCYNELTAAKSEIDFEPFPSPPLVLYTKLIYLSILTDNCFYVTID